MYPEEIEALIKSIVADGQYTDKEKRVLHKKAKEYGIDKDEIDVYVEGLAQSVVNEQSKPVEAPAPQPLMNEKMGNVRKCPNCGAVIGGGLVKCPECGYVFTNVKANSSAQLLASQLAHCNLDDMKKTILHFPIPTSKDDLIEFLISLKTKKNLISTSVEDNALIPVYEAKYNECLTKAKVLFPNDPELNSIIKETNDFKTNALIFVKRHWQYVLGASAILALILFVSLENAFTYDQEKFEAEIEEDINNKQLDDALKLWSKYPDYQYYANRGKFIASLVENDRIEDAINVFRTCHSSDYSNAKPIKDYYLKKGDYEEAEKYFSEEFSSKCESDSYSSNPSSIIFYKEVVSDMCEKGKLEDAKNYVRKVVSRYESKPSYESRMSKQSVQTALYEIINSYKK